MKEKLDTQFDAFIESFNQPYHVGLKVNTLKIDKNAFLDKFPFELKPVAWNPDGFYFDNEEQIAKHPYYHAGLFYIQEPSAMSPVMALNPEPGELCLDLCAAPGGKSMQIANAIQDSGLLVSNDINEKRVKAILRNAERFGLRNIVVLNESPDKIAAVMGHAFDSILIDAPCSGEGMFRKDAKAIKSWETFGPDQCQKMQREIIDHLDGLIKEQTKIVYSTCTFAPQENEAQMDYLTESKSNYSVKEIKLEGIENEGGSMRHMAHIWPHIHQGEGHFISCLVGKGNKSEPIQYNIPSEPPEQFKAFMDRHFEKPLVGRYEQEGDKIYLRPEVKLPTRGLRVVREGLLVGDVNKGRFTPSQALALHLKADDFHPIVDLPSNGIEVIKYLKGETLILDIETEGIHLVCTDGYPLGFSKITKGTLKNMYPASWRML
jgi:NOL1/NOP2/sun family putative RNA methylase